MISAPYPTRLPPLEDLETSRILMINIMKLIICFQNKKIQFNWQGGSLTLFREQLKKLLNIESEVEISFKDEDKDTIVIKDEYDFEYMLSNVGPEGDFELQVTQKCEAQAEPKTQQIPPQKLEREADQIQHVVNFNKKQCPEDTEIKQPLALKHQNSDETLALDGFNEEIIKQDFMDETEQDIKELVDRDLNQIPSKQTDNETILLGLDEKVENMCKSFIEQLTEIKTKLQEKNQNQKLSQVEKCDRCHNPYLSCEQKYFCLECVCTICHKCELVTAHEHIMLKVDSKTPQKELLQVMKLYRLSNQTKSDNESKVEFLKVILGEGYKEEFYDNFVANYENLSLQKFQEKVVSILQWLNKLITRAKCFWLKAP